MENSNEKVYYVCSKLENDVLENGTKEKPFSSIYKVKDLIRKQINRGMNQDIIVYIKSGEYNLSYPISFDENDSGRDGHKIYYKNFQNEKVVINGGKPITEWTKFNKNIYATKVKEGSAFNTIFEDGQRAIMARYPNMIKNSTPKEKFNIVAKTIYENKYRSIGFNEGDIPYIKDIENLQIYLWPGEEEGFCWHQNTMKVTEIDYKKKTITWDEDTNFGIGINCRYFIQGAFELIDEPGEFYLDRKNSILYYWPISEKNLQNGKIIVPEMDSVLLIKGSSQEKNVSNLAFEGLTIRYSNITDTYNYLTHGYGLVYLENANNISILNCDINNSGWHGVQLFGYVHDNTVQGNYIHNIGHTGIQLEDLPRGGLGAYINKKTKVINNYISIMGELVGHASCMEIIDSGDNFISHNKMEYSPRYCIGMSSMTPNVLIGKTAYDGRCVTKDNVKEYQHTRNNIIEYNDMSKANMDTQDTGIFETWCPGLGNVFNNNALHDSEIPFSFGTGLYLDDMADYFKVTNNIIYNLQKEGKGILGCAICAKGIGTEIRNNILADNNVTEKGGAIGTTDMARKRENYDLHLSRNIFYNNGNSAYVFSNWDEDRYTECDFNLFYNKGEICGVRGAVGIPDFIEMKEWKVVQDNKFDQYSIEDDPKFMDAQNFDYRLKYNSIAYAIDFNDIDFESIGLEDEFEWVDKSDELEKLYIKSHISGISSTINLDTKKCKEVKLQISGRTKKGYHLSNLEEYRLTYASDNEEVVIVDDTGKISIRKPGISKITVVASRNQSNKTSFIYVIVNDVFDRIEYILPKLNLVVGEKMLLKTLGRTKFDQYLKIDDVLKYTITDKNVVSIDNDSYISALNPGSTKIIFSAEIDGRFKTVNFEIKVYERMLKNIRVSVDKSILKIGETVDVNVSGIYKDGTVADMKNFNIDIYSNDIAILEYRDGKIIPKSPGEALIIANVEAYGEIFEKKIKIKTFIDEGLPKGWLVRNYGNAEGTASCSNGKYIVMSNGENIWFKADDFTFLCKNIEETMESDIITLEAKIHSIVETSENAQAGIMVRSSENNGSSHANFRTTPGGGLMLAYRVNNGDYISSVCSKQVTLPVSLRLVKKGKSITAYYKEDTVSIGQNKIWIEFSKVDIEIGRNFSAGLALFSNNSAVSTDAVYSEVSINRE